MPMHGFKTRLRRLAARLRKEALVEGHRCTPVLNLSDEDSAFGFVLCPHRKRCSPIGSQSDLDVRVVLAESEHWDGTEDGCSVIVDITALDGTMHGGLTPFNYTKDCWVLRGDKPAVIERFEMVENTDGFMAHINRLEAAI